MRFVLGIFALAAAALAAVPARATEYTYYRQILRGDTLVNEHAPPAPGTRVKRVRTYRVHAAHRVRRHAVVRRHVHRRTVVRRYASNRAIAGFCREGSLVRRLDASGRPIVVQREICDSIGFYSANPNDLQPRPAEFSRP